MNLDPSWIMKKPSTKAELIKKLTTLYVEEEFSVAEISEYFSNRISTGSILSLLREAKVQIKRRGGPNNKKDIQISTEDWETLPFEGLVKKYGVSRSYLRKESVRLTKETGVTRKPHIRKCSCGDPLCRADFQNSITPHRGDPWP